MTEAQKLQAELNEMMAKMRSAKESNSVKCEAPELKKSFTYRNSTVL